MHELFQDKTRADGKRARTRSLLLDSAISIVAEKGFEQTKITDVTQQAGLANGTFYNHFQDKDELMLEVAAGIAVEITARINEEIEGVSDAIARVVIATSRFMELAREEPDWVEVLLTSSDYIPDIQIGLVQFLRADIELGVEQGSFDVTIDSLLLNQVVGIVRVSLRVELESPGADAAADTCIAVLRILGVGPPRSRQAVNRILNR